jgi:capsular polysaccharide biosynthesis protein
MTLKIFLMSKTKQVIYAISLVIIAFVVILGFLCFPVIKDKYRFEKFVNSIHPQMSREQVQEIANKIGYYEKYQEVADKANVAKIRSDVDIDKICDVYYFRNFVLYNIVSIRYDKNGNVTEIDIDN